MYIGDSFTPIAMKVHTYPAQKTIYFVSVLMAKKLKGSIVVYVHRQQPAQVDFKSAERIARQFAKRLKIPYVVGYEVKSKSVRLTVQDKKDVNYVILRTVRKSAKIGKSESTRR